MRKKIVIAGFDDLFFLDVARKIGRYPDVEVVAVLGVPLEEEREWGNSFPSAEVVSLPEILSQEKIVSANRKVFQDIPQELWNYFGPLEGEIFVMMDRLALFPISGHHRREILAEYLCYWNHFFRINQIELVLFGATPHKVYDFVLFHMAKFFGIKTAYPERLLMDYRILILEDYRSLPKVPESFLKGETISVIKERIDPAILALIRDESFWLRRAKEHNQEPPPINRIGERLLLTGDLVKHIVRGNPLRKGFEEALAFNGPLRKIVRDVLFYILKNRYLTLKNFYQDRAIFPAAEQKFIYFPLHFQPERSTLPLGRRFYNQYSAVEILSKAVSAGWKIYVKEHPRQFLKPRLNAFHVRHRLFYEKLLSLRNVELVDYRADNAALIAKAVCVATITGSTGWEAMLAGKPCLAFGFPWYSGCSSCFCVTDSESCRTSLEALLKKTSAEVEKDVLSFLSFYQERFVFTANRYDMAISSRVDYTLLVDRLAAAFHRKLREQFDPLLLKECYGV